MNWSDGPREWSPRFPTARQALELLRAAIPPEFILEQSADPMWKIPYISLPGNDSRVEAKMALVVRIPDDKGGEAHVWHSSDGKLHIQIEIYYLLSGLIPGYEHLIDRWPWPGGYGPPTPSDPLQRHS